MLKVKRYAPRQKRLGHSRGAWLVEGTPFVVVYRSRPEAVAGASLKPKWYFINRFPTNNTSYLKKHNLWRTGFLTRRQALEVLEKAIVKEAPIPGTLS